MVNAVRAGESFRTTVIIASDVLISGVQLRDPISNTTYTTFAVVAGNTYEAAVHWTRLVEVRAAADGGETRSFVVRAFDSRGRMTEQTFDIQLGCNTDRTLCMGRCVDTTSDPMHCGECSHTCESPEGGRGTCTRSSCGIVCDRGRHPCGLACRLDTDAEACGASCTRCGSGPANSHPICTADGVCGAVCDSGYVPSNGACIPRCTTGACDGLQYCNLATGYCVSGCERDDSCGTWDGCNLRTHECVDVIVTPSGPMGSTYCPPGYVRIYQCTNYIDRTTIGDYIACALPEFTSRIYRIGNVGFEPVCEDDRELNLMSCMVTGGNRFCLRPLE